MMSVRYVPILEVECSDPRLGWQRCRKYIMCIVDSINVKSVISIITSSRYYYSYEYCCYLCRMIMPLGVLRACVQSTQTRSIRLQM